MSEEKKGVNVKTSRNWEDGVDHEDASTIWITEGHLHVGRVGQTKITTAIYAPGQWLSATVNK